MIYNLFFKDFLLSKYKSLEFQIAWLKPEVWNFFSFVFKINDYKHYFLFYFQFLGDLFKINLEWNREKDHAGFNIDLMLFGAFIEFNIYDTRHWDEENECWKKYE